MVGDDAFIDTPVILCCMVDKDDVAEFEVVILSFGSDSSVALDTVDRIICPRGVNVVAVEDNFDCESIIVECIVGSRMGWMMGTFVV
jgi:hypothetical protein